MSMSLKTEHRVDDSGNHHVLIDGLRVWVRKEGQHWVANGLDIDYAVAGESREQATRAFVMGLCLTIVEHVKRFHSLERLLARRAPDDIYLAWVREVESNRLEPRVVSLNVPEAELGDWNVLPSLPSAVKFFEPAAHAH
jgi:hypothetical protein